MSSNPSESSPLTKVHSRSLNELFAAHPDTITDNDIDRMVAELRAQRAHFKTAKQTKAKAPTIPQGTVDDILASIGLDKPIGRKE